MQALDVAAQLLHAVDLATPLDLDGHDAAVGVAADEVDRADRGGVLTAHERQAGLDRVRAGGQELLQVGLDAVLLQPGSTPSSQIESETTSCSVIVSCSPLGFVTTQRPVSSTSGWVRSSS